MGSKLNVYNLGSKGVVVDKSEIHTEDGELLRAQNAQVDTAGAMGAIRRRDGLSKLTSALAGAVRGVIGLPLPNLATLTRHFFVGFDNSGGAGTGSWRTSTDGTTWTTLGTGNTAPVIPASSSLSGLTVAGFLLTTWVTLNNRFYYPGNDYTVSSQNPTIHVFDGVTDAILCTIPQNPYASAGTFPLAVLSIIPYSATQLVISTADGSSGDCGRVFLLDVTTGQLTHLGPQTNINAAGVSLPLIPVLHQGKIWYASWNTSGGVASKVYWIRPGDLTWTHDANGDTGTGNGYCHGAASFKGDLYFGYIADIGVAGLLRKRVTSDGSFSTVRTVGSTSLGNGIHALIVSPDGTKLYMFENLATSAGAGTSNANIQRVLSYDGSAFTTEFDIGSTINNNYNRSGAPVFDDNGDLYWPFFGTALICQIAKRTAAGAWSLVDTAALPLRGPIVKLSY